jgi:uncharacterized membrane protein YraQ (UPF0718 family)
MAKGAGLVAAVLVCWFLPAEWAVLPAAVREALHLVRWYAREHVIFSLLPALLIAGAIVTFFSQDWVLRNLGAGASRVKAYAVASVSGGVLAVCSCSVLPLFAGICRMGAGIGPAATFLYAGPAINVLAIVLTGRVLGPGLGVARAAGAVLMSVLIGLAMARMFRADPGDRVARPEVPAGPAPIPLWKGSLVVVALAAVVVLTNWARTGDVRAVFLCCPNGLSTYQVEGRLVTRDDRELRILANDGQEHVIPANMVKELRQPVPHGLRDAVHRVRWFLVAALLMAVAAMAAAWFTKGQLREWGSNSWDFAVRITVLLLAGVAVSGLLFGRPGNPGLIPAGTVEMLVGQSPERLILTLGCDGWAASALRAAWPALTNLAAAVAGALMYFATLTEVPILQGLMASGMGQGPALALLLAGPSVSLPSLLVMCQVVGPRRAMAYFVLVVLSSAAAGLAYGAVS